jgi:protein-disulfide isomerase
MLSGQTAPATKTAPAVKTSAVAKAPAAVANYKEMGSPSAAITFEAYTDYECPHCALFFRDTVPQIMAQYVNTGKIKFLHRDFPLSQHSHAQLAARFANAAGQIGQYELVVNQIFKTQETWAKTGNIDAEVAKVLPPGAMQKVRDIVKNDAHLDDSIKKDVDMAMNVDHVPSTPTVVIVSKGKREVISTVLPFSTWKSYLDQKLASQ